MGRPKKKVTKDFTDDEIESTTKVEVGYAALHNSLFLGGKNHQDKLDSFHNSGLKMVYDKVEKELIVTWTNPKGSHVAHIPSTNVAYYIPGAAPDRKILQAGHTMHANISGTAQVETPMSHVHAGHGHGQTGVALK